MKNSGLWNRYVELNTGDYGKACVTVARRVMELLDEDPTPLHNGYYPDMNTAHGLIVYADRDTGAGGITGFMAYAVTQMVFECHERGDEFRKSYNGEQYDGDGVLDFSRITISPTE